MSTEPPFTLTRAQVREIDRRAAEEYGLPTLVLMENAGRGCAELLMRLNPDRRPTVVLCGPGNNGGDGFVIARHLDNAGWPAEVWLFAQLHRMSADATANFTVVQRSELATLVYRAVTERFVDVTPVLASLYTRSLWVVDAIFGTGLTRPLGEPYSQIVADVNASRSPVLAVDLPSGLDCDTGEPLGPTVRATHTATFVAAKAGFANPRSREWTGAVHVIDIGAPRKLIAEYRSAAGQ